MGHDPFRPSARPQPQEAAPAAPQQDAIPPGGQQQQSPASDAPAAAQPPEGTVSEVLAWVGEDRMRARVALRAERDGQARKTLLEPLARLVRGGER